MNLQITPRIVAGAKSGNRGGSRVLVRAAYRPMIKGSMEQREVFVVVSGIYSDFGINAIFSTREKAQAYIDNRADVNQFNDYRIEVYGLDEYGDINSRLIAYWVKIDKDDNASIERIGPNHSRSEAIDFRVGDATVWARDEQHAAKIAMERYMRWKAEQ